MPVQEMKIEMWAIEGIKPYESNPRNNDDAVDAVAKSIREYGWQQPIVLDSDHVIVVGHTRWKAAKKLGLERVPVLVATNLTPDQVRAYRLADNRLNEIATWNYDLLPIEIDALKEANYDLGLLGFDTEELAKIMGNGIEEGLTDPDDVPLPPDEAVTQPGDLWILGNHRLLCGDSSNPEHLDRLLAGKPIHLVNTDPPYNVKVEPRSKNAIAAGLSSFTNDAASSKLKNDQGMAAFTHAINQKNRAKAGASATATVDAPKQKMRAKDRPLANDFVSDDEFDRLLDTWFGNIARVLLPGHVAYIWGGYANCGNYPPYLKKHGLYFSQAIIWLKEWPVLSRKDFMGNHEWCQPPDTIVRTTAGSSRLGALRDGDRVVSYDRHNSATIGLRHGYEVRVGTRNYHGTLFGVTVGAKQTWATDGHLWTARLAKGLADRWCVYLMRRGNWWRVGVTKLRTTWGFGLKGRLCHEHGDEAWILSVHNTNVEARLHEQFVSVTYGIPLTCWVSCRYEHQRQATHIADFYAMLDLDKLDLSVRQVLGAYQRDPRYPLVQKDRAELKSVHAMQVRSCNLLPEVMEVPVPSNGEKITWQLIRAIDIEPYAGLVHSLGVDRYEHYIADGIVTHNCFYTWKEGAGHRFFGPNNATDTWSVKKVSPQSMVHLTEKPVELAIRAMQYSSLQSENVLDLFGGSGSTLIGAEQTGRNAFLMEIDAPYCDVICQRFFTFSGVDPIRESDGAKWSSLNHA